MDKYFLPYEIALQLKEIDFDEECWMAYSPSESKYADKPILIQMQHPQPTIINSKIDEEDCICTAPLYDQVIDWFIEKYKITIYASIYHWNPDDWACRIHDEKGLLGNENLTKLKGVGFTDRYEALNAGILKAIELIKQNEQWMKKNPPFSFGQD